MRRLRQPLALIYFATFLLLAASAILHFEPNNYDHLSYRFPRLLHWHAESSWFWIVGGDDRSNFSGFGFEWMWFPFFVLWKSDFGAILLNLVGFALLPGLIYRAFVGLGLPGRIAKLWMWVLPLAYCYVLQAAGAGNDFVGAVLALAAFAFLLEARSKKTFPSLALGILAAALCSGIKLSNAPLLLPLGILALASWRLIITHWLRLAPIAVTAVAVSFIPLAAINITHTGDLTGDPENDHGARIENPLAGITGNALQIKVASLTPPVNPFAPMWNRAYPGLFPDSFESWLGEKYPRFGLRQREIIGEEDGGLGLGLAIFLLLSLLAVTRSWRQAQPWSDIRLWTMLATWAAFFVFLAKLGSECSPRIAAPYYPVLIASALIFFGCSRFRWPRTSVFIAALCMLMAWPVIILMPARPLWPWQLIANQLPADSAIANRLRNVYSIYAQRHDAFAPLKEAVPSWPELRRIGVVGLGDDPESSLWKPFDGRRVIYISASSPPPDLWNTVDIIIGRTPAINTLLASEIGDQPDQKPLNIKNSPLNIRNFSAFSLPLSLKAQAGPQEWTTLLPPQAGEE